MKRLAFAFLLLAVPTSLQAKDITVTMDEAAWSANLQLLDIATKAQGIAVAEAALFIKKKIEDAAKAAAEPPKVESLPKAEGPKK